MITQKLLNAVAQHLSGRPVVLVRYQVPVWSDASGACYKTIKGDVIIDINPGARDFLYTFLHEIAHCRYDFSKMTPSNVWKSEPGSLKVHPSLQLPNAPVREDAADEQASRWKDYAAENAWKYYNGDNLLEKELLALLDAPDPYSKSSKADYIITRNKANRGKTEGDDMEILQDAIDSSHKDYETWKRRQLDLANDFQKIFGNRMKGKGLK